MAHYYSTRPCVITVPNVSDEGEVASEDVSEFDKHRETLLSDDAEEGWAPELCRYTKTMQRDVKKDADIVEWWQVSNLNNKARYLLIKSSIEPCPALPNTCAYRA